MSGPVSLPSLSASTKGQGGGAESTDSTFTPSQVTENLVSLLNIFGGYSNFVFCTDKNMNWYHNICHVHVCEVAKIIDLPVDFALISIYGFVLCCVMTISFC